MQCGAKNGCVGSYVEWDARVVSPDNLREKPFTNIWQDAPGFLKGRLVQIHVLKLPRVAVSIGMQTKAASNNPLYLDLREFPGINTPIIAGSQLYVAAAWEQAEPELFDASGTAPARYSNAGIKCTNFDDGVQMWFQSVDEAQADNKFRPVVYLRAANGEWARHWFSNDLRDTSPTWRQSQSIVVPVRDADRIYGYPEFSAVPTDGMRVSYGRLTAPNPAQTGRAKDDLVVRFGATIME